MGMEDLLVYEDQEVFHFGWIYNTAAGNPFVISGCKQILISFILWIKEMVCGKMESAKGEETGEIKSAALIADRR